MIPIPFKFQKEIKANECEDSPPIAAPQYSIVCDGLGGSGYTKHMVMEADSEQPRKRTSAYLGSRIVSDCVNAFYQEKLEELEASIEDASNLEQLMNTLKDQLVDTISKNIEHYKVTLPRSTTTKIFPTTLASASYFPCGDKLLIVSVWAGDSRIYILTPSKGLQLLSLDDADHAADSMNSGTSMNNCICVGKFHLNYSVYTLAEPGIIFCCSDGCFDYLRSPLHMEWLLLSSILSAPSENESEMTGTLLAESIRDGMYQSIRDDTTMAGICFRLPSMADIQEAFRLRLDEFNDTALKMNEHIKKKIELQDRRDNAQKICHLNEAKAADAVEKAICDAIVTRQPPPLYKALISMPAFADYREKRKEKSEQMRKEDELETKRLREQIDHCRNQFKPDYLCWKYQGGQNRNRKWRISKNANVGEDSWNPENVDVAVQILIEAVKRGVFLEGRPSDAEGAIPALNQIRRELHQSNRKEVQKGILQAYFSTDIYSEERGALDYDEDFQKAFCGMLETRVCPEYCGSATRKAYYMYVEAKNAYKKYQASSEKKREHCLRKLTDHYYAQHKETIMKELFRKDPLELKQIFSESGIATDQLLMVAEARQTLRQFDSSNEIGQAQDEIDSLWNQYRNDYELFNQIERGKVSYDGHSWLSI